MLCCVHAQPFRVTQALKTSSKFCSSVFLVGLCSSSNTSFYILLFIAKKRMLSGLSRRSCLLSAVSIVAIGCEAGAKRLGNAHSTARSGQTKKNAPRHFSTRRPPAAKQHATNNENGQCPAHLFLEPIAYYILRVRTYVRATHFFED